MVAAIAALGRIGQRQQVTFIAAHQLLQARGTRAGVDRRGAGDIVGRRAAIFLGLRQPLLREQAKDVRRRLCFAIGLLHRRRFAVGQQGKIEQAMGVVVGGAQQLAAGNVFVHCGDAAFEAHLRSVNRFADRQPRQGGAVGAQQEDRFDVITAGLLERQRRQFAVGDAALGHHPVHRQVELVAYLINAQFGKPSIAPPFLFL